MKGGLKNGLGIMHLEDQSKIFGVWKNNILQGLGVSLRPSGIVSLGHFEVRKRALTAAITLIFRI